MRVRMNSLQFFKIILAARKSTSFLSAYGYRVFSRCSRQHNFITDHASKCIQMPWFAQQRSIYSSCFLFKESSAASKPSNDTIQLLGINGELRGVMKLRKAELLAKEEQLKLLRVESKDAVQPIFRLVTVKEFNLEQKQLKALKKAEKTKAVKTLRLSSIISSHDLENKVSHILEWLEKGHQVKVAIKTGKSTEGENRVFDQITVACKEHATIQSSKKTEAELVFQLLPKTESVAGDGKTSVDCDQKPLKLDELKKMRSAEESAEIDSKLGERN